MPFTLVVQLLNGQSFPYTVRPRLGKAAWTTHLPRLTELVSSALDLPQDQYIIQFIFGDEEQRLTDIIQRLTYIIPQYQPSSLDLLMRSPSSPEYTLMNQERYITQDTIIYALAEPRPHDPLMESLQQSFHHLIPPSQHIDALMEQ
jgi:hypothetical protein